MTKVNTQILEKILKASRKSDIYECLPFVSIDIETTGTDPQTDQILQVAAIFHNGKWGLTRESMPKINFKIFYDPNKYKIVGNAYALTMQKNYEMISEMGKLTKKQVYDQSYDPKTKKLYSVKERNSGWVLYEDAPKLLAQFLLECKEKNNEYYKHFELREQALTLAGKNLAGFDLPFLKEQLGVHDNGPDGLYKILTRGIKHRHQDIGSMFYSVFGFVPSLDDINQVTERNVVSHDAEDDAYDCIEHSLTMLRVFRQLVDFYNQNQSK